MLSRRGLVALGGLLTALPVVVTVMLFHPPFRMGPGAVVLFVLFLSGISVLGFSVIVVSLLERSNRFTLAVSAGVAFAYTCCLWIYMLFFQTAYGT